MTFPERYKIHFCAAVSLICINRICSSEMLTDWRGVYCKNYRKPAESIISVLVKAKIYNFLMWRIMSFHCRKEDAKVASQAKVMSTKEVERQKVKNTTLYFHQYHVYVSILGKH